MPARGGASGLYNEEYGVNNVIEGDPLYAGKTRPNGVWLVLRYSSSAGTVVYANRGNNPGVLTYADAWAAREALSYAVFEQLLGY